MQGCDAFSLSAGGGASVVWGSERHVQEIFPSDDPAESLHGSEICFHSQAIKVNRLGDGNTIIGQSEALYSLIKYRYGEGCCLLYTACENNQYLTGK